MNIDSIKKYLFDGLKKSLNNVSIDKLIDPFVFFVKKDKNYYGIDENGRITFAQWKNPDKWSPKIKDDQIMVSVYNLNKLCHGESPQEVFTKKDFSKMKVVSRDEVLKKIKCKNVISPENLIIKQDN